MIHLNKMIESLGDEKYEGASDVFLKLVEKNKWIET
jgi:hypothetical protein